MTQADRFVKQYRFDGVKHTIRKIEGVLEVLIMSLAFYIVWRKYYPGNIFPTYYGNGKYVLIGIYFALLTILFYFDEGFKYGHLKLTDVLVSQWICLVLVNGITYFQLSLIANKLINIEPMILLTGIEWVIAFVATYVFTTIYHHFYVPKNMLMIYGDEKSIGLKVKMDTRSDKYCIKRMISIKEDFDYIIKEIPKYDAIVINDIPSQVRNDILKFCYSRGLRVYVTPKISDVLVKGSETIHLFDTPLFLIRSRALNYEQRFLKRMLDIVLCGMAMLIAWPFMLIIAIAIKIEDHGPVFYKQRRVTIDGKEFDILKFRSMIVDAEKDDKSIPATDHDPRITKVGRVIRAIRVDEIPQILNILKGDSGIIGTTKKNLDFTRVSLA